MAQFIKSDISFVYVAREQGRVVGYLIAEMKKRREASFLHIMSLGVLSTHRRKVSLVVYRRAFCLGFPSPSPRLHHLISTVVTSAPVTLHKVLTHPNARGCEIGGETEKWEQR